MRFDLIAFDADDTLWHNEIYYRAVEQRFLDMLSDYAVEREDALRLFHSIEIANLPDFGYGVRGFVLSLIEAGIQLTGGALSGGHIQAIIELGRGMAREEVRLLPGAAAALESLAGSHRLALITKGDLIDQERKIANSGLAGKFQHVEIVSDKTPAVYAALLEKNAARAERFLMVGNSLRSDVLPALAVGGCAVHVPTEMEWAHEAAGELPAGSAARLFTLRSLADLAELVKRIENGAG